MIKDFLPSLRKQSLASGRPASIADLMEEFWREPSVIFSPFSSSMSMGAAAYPALDVSETDKEIVAKAELPGMDPKDVEVTLRDNVLTIKGEKKFEGEEKKDNYHRIERSYGSFQRSISLPASVKEDAVKAKFDKGVLTITMGKQEEAKVKTIPIAS
jgi:HSP20 family protein